MYTESAIIMSTTSDEGTVFTAMCPSVSQHMINQSAIGESNSGRNRIQTTELKFRRLRLGFQLVY